MRIDYTNTTFGPLTLLRPSAKKREWIARCDKGHETSVRPDTLKRTKPEVIQCRTCSVPAPLQSAVNDAQKEALALLARTLDLTVKACGGVLAAFGKSAA